MNSGWYSTKHVEEKLLDKIKNKDMKKKYVILENTDVNSIEFKHILD